MNHDVIAIGASAGGVKILLDLVREFPPDLAASVFIVLHEPATFRSPLAELLSEKGTLPASHPLHEEPIVTGHIYVAPPDNHLLLRQGFMEIVRGPKENGHRPAVDATFRTAAASYGPRVIGVVLSGTQNCGTAGMLSIKARGGISVVQSPESAQHAEMPNSVIAHATVDHIVEPRNLAALLIQLVALPVANGAEPDRTVRQLEGDERGEPAEVVCPLCQGVLTRSESNGFLVFRCHVGHAFTLERLLHEQDEEVERAMWAAIRALEEGAALNRRLVKSGTGELRMRFDETARTQARQADVIRRILLRDAITSRVDDTGE